MYRVIIDAKSLSQYFNLYILGENEFIHRNIEYIKSIDGFQYPIHYGSSNLDSDIYDEFLLIDNSYLIYNGTKYYLKDYESTFRGSPSGLFEFDEILTFEFETEEEALYFKMKYGS